MCKMAGYKGPSGRRGGHLAPNPPSSPSVALFKDGAVVDFLPRLRIEGRSAIDVERDLVAMFEKHFAAK